MKYNIISYLNKNLHGQTKINNENKNTELEIYKEILLEMFDKYDMNLDNKILIIKNNSLYIESNSDIIKSFLNKVSNSSKLLNDINLKKIEKFEDIFFKLDSTYNKKTIYNYYKKVIYYTILVFHISDIVYEKIYKIFQKNNKTNLFFDSICVEKENFFLRIAKEGLKENFSRVFKLKEFKPQNLEKKEKLNSMDYMNYNFLTNKEKKMISTLNTLQYLQDEKNNYLNFVDQVLKEKFRTYYLIDNNESKLNKYIKSGENYFIINQNNIILETDKNLYYFLKNNRKISEINLTQNRKKEFLFLIKNHFIYPHKKTITNINNHIKIKPSLIIINTTNRCNLNCIYCYNNIENKDIVNMNNEKVINAINKITTEFNLKYYTIVFHGGEPLLELENIKKIISNFKDKNENIKYSFQTNGMLINNEFIKYIKLNKINISISIDGPDFINIKSRTNDIKKNILLENNIKLLNENNIKYNVLCTLSKMNIDNSKELVEYYNKINCRGVRFNTLILTGNASKNNLFVTNKEYYTFFENIVKMYLNNKIKFKVLNIDEMINIIENSKNENRNLICYRDPCGAGSSMININGNGDLSPCGEISNLEEFKISYKDYINKMNLKNLFKKKFKRIYIDSKIENIKKCKNCKFSSICTNGCFGKNYYYNDHKIGINPYCSFQKQFILLILKKYKELKEKEVIK